MLFKGSLRPYNVQEGLKNNDLAQTFPLKYKTYRGLFQVTWIVSVKAKTKIQIL